MKTVIIAAMLASFVLISNESFAQTTGVGAGLILGVPTGISAKF